MKCDRVKRIMAAALALTLIISLPACASKETTYNSNASASQTETTGSASETKIDKLGKYDSVITVTSVRGVNAGNTFPQGDDIENNVYTRMVKDELGITVKYDWVSEGSDGDTKVATMLASNSMPDFFRASASTFMNLAKADAIMDITELYDTWASDRLKKLDESFKEGYESGFVNGKHYGIADLGWGTISLPRVLWIRPDWLAQSGMQAPKTLDDLEALAKKFMEQHPGSYGIALDKGLTGGINTIVGVMNAYHAYPGVWIKKDNKLEFGSVQPEVKTALSRLQTWYSKGIIDKEFAVKDSSKVIEDITNGKVGITYAENNIGFWATPALAKNNPDGALMPYDVPKTDDQPLYLQGGWPIGTYTVINKNMKNPEAVLKLINLFCEKYADGTFSKPENSKTEWSSWPGTWQVDPMNEYKTFVNISKVLKTGDESILTPDQMMYYNAAKLWKDKKDTVTDPSAYGRYAQMGPNGAYSVIKPYVDNDRIMVDKLAGAPPEGYAKVVSTLDKLQVDAFTKIIMGGSIDSFDKFVTEWKKVGGDVATQEVNDTFNK